MYPKSMCPILAWLAIIIIAIILVSIKQINQYERGARFTLGKYSGIIMPGWRLVFPIFQTYKKIDLRVKTIDVPQRGFITKNDISITINSIASYRVVEAEKIALESEDFHSKITQLALITIRNVIEQADSKDIFFQTKKYEEKIKKIGLFAIYSG